MTATTVTTAPTTTRTTPLWRTGAAAGLVAAAATTAIAAVTGPLEIDGEAIPTLGFAQLTLICTAIGVGLAKVVRRRRTFTAVTVVLTVLSLVPDVVVEATTGTKVALMATHVVAAAIVIPALARRLPEQG